MYPFIWDMLPHHWVICYQYFEITIFYPSIRGTCYQVMHGHLQKEWVLWLYSIIDRIIFINKAVVMPFDNLADSFHF
jgi:hypothetical protein